MTNALIEAGQPLVLDGFVKPTYCLQIMQELRYSWWWHSELAYLSHDCRLISTVSVRRTSQTTNELWMNAAIKRQLRLLERALAKRFQVNPNTFEPWQAFRYRRGEHFAEHHDAGLFDTSLNGERTLTFLLYLDDHTQGGATVFPELALRIRPRIGRLIVWRNLLDDGTVDMRMRHAAMPARNTKTVLTTWSRQRAT